MMTMQPQMIASLPIWLAGLLIAGFAMMGAVLVELLVRRLISLEVRTNHSTAASAMFNVVGTTYAVLLAFVAMLAWDGFNKAQSVTDTEASLVQNVYQLVDGLTGPDMVTMRSDIIAYAATVVETEWPAQAKGIVPRADDPTLIRLTRTALHLRPGNIADGDLHTLLLDDLTKLSSVRRERLLVQRNPIPLIVWLVLLAGGSISVAFASFLGARSLRMHLVMSFLLTLSGALVLLLIVALSNPFRGDFRISPEPFERVLAQMTPDGSGASPR
ncbi:hypothetical protein [Rhodopila sp.]|uniref:bestrophin-like domain n=1 Tax=Rhodopila sp. TaxID=2480087 RepID=UPI003D0E684F